MKTMNSYIHMLCKTAETQERQMFLKVTGNLSTLTMKESIHTKFVMYIHWSKSKKRTEIVGTIILQYF